MSARLRLAALAVVLAHLAGCAGTPANPNQLPSTLAVKRDVALPMPSSLGIYMAAGTLQYTEIFRSQIVQRGRFTRTGVDAVAKHFFTTVVHRDTHAATPIQLMLDLDTKWTGVPGKITLEMPYKLYDATGKEIRSGTKSETAPIDATAPDVLITNLVIRATQAVMVEIVNFSSLDVQAATATTTVDQFPVKGLINEEMPYRLGTGFYVNGAGQVVTAAGIVQDCLRIDVGAAPAVRTAKLTASSALLNLAVLDTGSPATTTLALSGTKPALGATSTSVSFMGTKEGQVNRGLSFGNVTSYDGAASAFGVFQFSTATKPQTHGAPLLGPDGKLIGIYAGGYSYDWLQKQNLLPANTFQALDVGVATTFLNRNKVAYSTDPYPDEQPAVDRATAATVQIACYQ